VLTLHVQDISRIWRDVKRENGQPLHRFWDLDDLRHAITVPSYEQMAPVVQKLESGLALTVVALGSSITSEYGGAFQPSLDDIFR
jgi:hypothetical protein